MNKTKFKSSIYDVPYSPLSENIRTIRETLNLTMKDLARLIDCKEISIFSWEKERRCPNFEIVLRLSILTELTLDELCGLEPFDIVNIYKNNIDTNDLKELVNDCKKKFAMNLYSFILDITVSDVSMYKYAIANKIGITNETLNRWQKGNIPHIDKLIMTAKYFNISIEELVGLVPLDYNI